MSIPLSAGSGVLKVFYKLIAFESGNCDGEHGQKTVIYQGLPVCFGNLYEFFNTVSLVNLLGTTLMLSIRER